MWPPPHSDYVSVAYVHGLLLNMEMRLAHHRSCSASPFDQTTTALFTPKIGKQIIPIVVGAIKGVDADVVGGMVHPTSIRLMGRIKIIMQLVRILIVDLHVYCAKFAIGLATLPWTVTTTWTMHFKGVISLTSSLLWLP